MTNEEARAYFIDNNEKIISVAKDENIYNYETQQVEDVFMRRTFEANELAIKALDQKPKSEWQQDHEILKAYSDGANNMLDIIETDIKALPKTYPFVNHIDAYVKEEDVRKILDEYSEKYTTEKYVAGSTVVNIIDRTTCTYTEPTDCYSAIAITCNKGPEN